MRVGLFNLEKLQIIKSITIKGKVTTKTTIIIEKDEVNVSVKSSNEIYVLKKIFTYYN